MSIAVRIDDWILKRFQLVSEWSEVHWGQNCYHLAGHTARAGALGYVVMVFGTLSLLTFDAAMPLLVRLLGVLGALILLGNIFLTLKVASYYDRMGDVGQPVLMTVTTLRFSVLIFMVSILSMLVVVDVVSMSFGMLDVGISITGCTLVVRLYFLSCYPLHPDAVRKRQLARVGQGNLKEA